MTRYPDTIVEGWATIRSETADSIGGDQKPLALQV